MAAPITAMTASATAKMRQKVGVAFPFETGPREGQLIDWRGRDGINLTALRRVNSADDGVVGGASGC